MNRASFATPPFGDANAVTFSSDFTALASARVSGESVKRRLAERSSCRSFR